MRTAGQKWNQVVWKICRFVVLSHEEGCAGHHPMTMSDLRTQHGVTCNQLTAL